MKTLLLVLTLALNATTALFAEDNSSTPAVFKERNITQDELQSGKVILDNDTKLIMHDVLTLEFGERFMYFPKSSDETILTVQRSAQYYGSHAVNITAYFTPVSTGTATVHTIKVDHLRSRKQDLLFTIVDPYSSIPAIP